MDLFRWKNFGMEVPLLLVGMILVITLVVSMVMFMVVIMGGLP